MKHTFILVHLLIFFHLSGFSQLTVNNGLTGQQLADMLAGENITATNVSITGNSLQYGSFTFAGTGLDVQSGVILSTGIINDAIGPNNSDNTSHGFNGPGNELLSQLAESPTFDAVVLEFSFEVQTDRIEFNFNFLSEEYNEYVGSQFNDVFAFFISGPGITGEENLAVIPGTTIPVSVNTINNQEFWQFYHDNTNGNTNIEFDGFTTLLKAEKSGLIPCETYTLKFMLADAGDPIYDAGVLLQENSLVQASVSGSASTYSENNVALEGCIDANFIFELDQAVDHATYIPLQFGGNAVNGVDYKYLDSMIVIPAGQTSARIIVEAFGDGLTEGQEVIEISYLPGPCRMPETINLYIDDYSTIEFMTEPENASCNGNLSGSASFTVTGGIPPYVISLTDTLTSQTVLYDTNPVTGLPAGTYKVEIIDGYGCQAEDIVYGDIYDGGAVFLPDGTGLSYETSIMISGFGANQTLTSINQIQSIGVNMEHSNMGELEIILQAPNGIQMDLKSHPGGAVTNLGEPVACGPVDQCSENLTPGIGYDYYWIPNATFGTMKQEANSHSYTYVTQIGTTESDKYLPSGSYDANDPFENLIGVPLNGEWKMIITDHNPNDNGYIFNWSISLNAQLPDSIFTINEPVLPVISSEYVNPSCNESNGSINITVTGDQTPYTYLWNTGATSQDLFNIPAGSYSIEITGSDQCTYDFAFTLSNNGSFALLADSDNETCEDGNNGNIDLTVNGGTSPYLYLWNNGAQTEDISGLAPGNYTVTVNDAENCISVGSYTINAAVPIFYDSDIIHENCGDAEGAIDLSVSGGQAPYTFLWNNGKTSEDVNELAQGTYTVTITDSNGCTAQASYSIINYVGNCIPDCDFAVTNEVLTDEICGQQNGAIDLTIFTSFSPYTVEWSNGSSLEDISNLSAGTYSITMTDAEGCTLIKSYSLENNSGTLQILSIFAENETCGNGLGSVDITVNGGALPYAFDWNNGATTEDLVNINEGSYQIVVTDANGCSVYDDATVINESGTLELVWSNVMDETCGNNNGSIDIWVQGGNPLGNQNPHYIHQWTNGATTEDLMFIGEGAYQCVITDQDGCQISTPMFEVENLAGTMAFTTIDIDPEICGNGQGEIELFVAGGAGSYTYVWSTGSNQYGIFNVSAGVYSATVSDQNGCSLHTGELEVLNLPGTLALESVVVSDELCGNSQGSINVSLSGGSLPYSTIWNTGSTSEDLLNLNAGNYSCVINDTNGCEISFNTSVENLQGTLTVLNTVVSNETCGNENGAVQLILNGGTTPYNYIWSNGATSEDITNLSSGSYSCIITDFQGCQADAYAVVGNNSGTLHLDNSILTNEQCGGENGSINLIVSGTATPFTYNWSNAATTEDIYNLPAGIYSCIITDALGCSITAGPFTVNNTSALMSVNYSVTDETCSGANGSIDLSIVGGTNPYSYLWSNGANSQDISGLQAGEYTYSVTDNIGCTLTGAIQVLNNSGSFILSNAVLTDETCSNGTGSVNITITGGTLPYSYSWNTGALTEDIYNLSTGTYHVTVTENGGCEITSPVYQINNNPGNFTVVSIQAIDEICGNADGEISVLLSGGTNPITYNWSNGAILKDINGLSQGGYSCVTVDNNGCTLNYSAYVQNDPGSLYAEITEITDASCGELNGAIDMTVMGGGMPYAFAWSNGATSEDISSIAGGVYTCFINDQNGCETNINATVEDIGGDLSVTVIGISDETCGNENGAVNISVTGGTTPYSYFWSNGETEEDLTGLSAGTFKLTVTDAMGCMRTLSATVNNLTGDMLVSSNITNEICSNGEGQIDITVTGSSEPYTYLWDNGETTQDIGNLSVGNYTVTISNVNGCEHIESFTIANTVTLEISSEAVNETCGESNGSIDISVSASSGTPGFLWSNGATTEDLYDIPAGTYSCEIADEAGCSASVYHEIINETGDMIVVPNITDDYCGQGGSVVLDISGTSSGYTILWSTGSTETGIYNLTAGSYTVEVTDNSNGCKYYETFTIESTGAYTVSESITNSTCETCNDGSIDLTIDPSDTYTIIWSNGETTEDISELLPGAYTVVILNPFSCEFEETYTIGYEILVINPEESSIFVYPNPTKDLFKIEYTNMNKGTSVKLVNITGTLMYETEINNEKGTIEIFVSEYAAGIYFLTIENNDQNKTIKILKQN
jgi:subtilisin-like proprotein convertase family protein